MHVYTDATSVWQTSAFGTSNDCRGDKSPTSSNSWWQSGSDYDNTKCYEQFSQDMDNFILDVPGGSTEVTPEPATMTLLATGLAGMAAARRRKRAAQD